VAVLNPAGPKEHRNWPVEVIRKTLFASETLQIGLFQAHPASDVCGEVERQASNAMVLPVSGVFSKHDAPGRYVIGTPSHAVFFAADAPYRIGFPGAIGDRALVLRFAGTLAADYLDRRAHSESLASPGLLSPDAMMLRNLLWARLQNTDADAFESEAVGLDLLGMSLSSLRRDGLPRRRAAIARRRRAVERVKEVVALAPADRWTVAGLAKIANLSPFHLCHVFRQMVGTSIYDYVLHERLARSLDAVLDSGDDLTAIALDAGFASHSHFTARFRRFFGCTPTALRRIGAAELAAKLRKITTARRRQFA
jgi:AraC family transcriptional regulator